MKLGSLFSGAGLGDLGWLMAGFDIRWQCEIDDYCQKILNLRFPETEKYHDIKTLKGKELEPVDIVAGGFPCQPFSVAGNQRGEEDDRNLWPQMFRVIKEVRPTWVVGENVSGIIPIYLDNVLSNLESEGYACRTFVFPAHALGAAHRRERIWVVGYSEGKRVNRKYGNDKCKTGENGSRPNKFDSTSEDVANSKSKGRELRAEGEQELLSQSGKRLSGSKCYESIREYWATEPGICRVVDGCSDRVDRLKALGNGQVMACTAFIGQKIMEFERLNNG